MFTVNMGLLFTKPLSIHRITALTIGILSILSAGVFPFFLFLSGVLSFEAARYFGSFMFYAGLTVCLYIGLSTKFKPNWKIRKQIITLATLLFVTLSIFAVIETPAVNALTPLPIDHGPNGSSAYKFSVPFTEYQWLIAQFRDGTYYAINGSDWNIMTIVEPWQAVPPWVALSTNKTALIQQAISVTTGGKILLNELTFPYTLTIPTNVTIIESCKGLTREFISSTNSQGSPITVSVDTVNPTYYLAQDSQGRFINSWSSTDTATTIQNAVTGLPTTGGSICFDKGTFLLTNQIEVTKAGANPDIKIYSNGGTVVGWASNPATQKYLFNFTLGMGTGEICGFDLYGGDYANSGAIYTTSCNPIFIHDLYIYNFHYGLYYMQEAHIDDCRITYTDTCIYLFGRNMVTNCHIAPNENGAGIKCGPTPDTIISGNTILGDVGNSGVMGIRVDGEGATITGNDIRDCGSRGIFIGAAGYYDVTITGNTIYSFYVTCTYGIQSLGENIFISGNNIFSRSQGTHAMGTGIAIHANAINNTVINNNIYRIATPISNASATTKIYNNCLNNTWFAAGIV